MKISIQDLKAEEVIFAEGKTKQYFRIKFRAGGKTKALLIYFFGDDEAHKNDDTNQLAIELANSLITADNVTYNGFYNKEKKAYNYVFTASHIELSPLPEGNGKQDIEDLPF